MVHAEYERNEMQRKAKEVLVLVVDIGLGACWARDRGITCSTWSSFVRSSHDRFLQPIFRFGGQLTWI